MQLRSALLFLTARQPLIFLGPRVALEDPEGRVVKVARVQREVVVDKVDRVLTVRVIKVARGSEG